jgi:hypothetical protein
VQLSAETLYKWGEEFPVERVLEIPIGDWCYGDTWYEYFTKTHNQKEGHGCPFHQHNYCAFMKVYDSYLLADSTKICPYRDVEKVLKKLYETPIQ